MDVPLWLAVIVVGYLGIRLTRPPIWLVVLLLIGGYLLAHSFLGPAVGSLVN
ncbi:hypothetical protein ACFYWS_31555 [Streptomyces sp. NPDC002795]|uniref:hypothetical protein n=1 Tax=Streptomyces sp. NPDC002795 TaxID=3364665 RepID=UPI00368C861A